MPDDIAAAARRVTEDVNLGFYRPLADLHADLLALLPLLDTVAARRDDAGRVERWARDLCRLDGIDPDQAMSDGGTPWWTAYRDNALGVIALADAEGAAHVTSES